MDNIILTRKQEEGLKIALERYKNKEPYTCIAGYAGTGKSTLVSHIIAALGVDKNEVCYIAYTGKAAQVLRDKGNAGAMTAHRLLYKHIPKGDGTFIKKIIRPLYPAYKVIVVDEISMLPMSMWTLLLSHNIYVLALGDPGQLPPIATDDSNDVLQHPHIFLDEVLRQAQDSSIIRLSMDIRDFKPLRYYKDDEVQVVSKKEYLEHPGMIKWADQIICAKNATRTMLNHKYREDLMDEYNHAIPTIGDKLICLRNVWNSPNMFGDCMVNGLIGTLEGIKMANNNPFVKPTIIGDFLPEGYEDMDSVPLDFLTFNNLLFDPKIFATGEKTMATKLDYRRIPEKFRPYEFDYAYAITCHKAQGSEYGKILIFEEYMKGDNKESHARWLYTAVTRAKYKLIVVKA